MPRVGCGLPRPLRLAAATALLTGSCPAEGNGVHGKRLHALSSHSTDKGLHGDTYPVGAPDALPEPQR